MNNKKIAEIPINFTGSLEDIVQHFGKDSVDGGNIFEDLCCRLISAMGFTDVYRRSGYQNGRDIDAKCDGKVWAFECKRGRDAVNSEKTIYKFAQIDILHDNLKPDYFVILSNASTRSVLRDIVRHKSQSHDARYKIFIWANDGSDKLFNRILLSYSNVYVDFIGDIFGDGDDRIVRLVKDFQDRSELYLRERRPFFEEWKENFGYRIEIKKDESVVACSYMIKSVVNSMVNAKRMPVVDLPILPFLGICAVPVDHCLYDALSGNGINFPVKRKALERFGLRHDSSNTGAGYTIYRENSANKTRVYDSGCFVLTTEMSFSKLVLPTDWLYVLRENSIRIRNFIKSSLLPTPCVIKCFIGKAQEPVFHHLKSDEFDKLYMRRIAHDPSTYFSSESGDDYATHLVESDNLYIANPTDDYEGIGRPLAHSLWRNLTNGEDLNSEILFLRNLLWKMKADMSLVIEWEKATCWYMDGEVLSRGYDMFE